MPSHPELLWPSGAPGALGDRPEDKPTITPCFAPAEKATGAAVVILPGGGYGGLAGHEGVVYADYLNTLGIHGFVVDYRLGPNGYKHPCMWQDATRAMRMVRARAREWGVDPNRVGIMGSSAGGHLASTVLTRWDQGDPTNDDLAERQPSRPDLGILCYPVITMRDLTHGGSRLNLLGENPSAELVDYLSGELQVNAQTPPCFLLHTFEDQAVPVLNSVNFAKSLAKHSVPFELHVYERGVHGIGLGCNPFDPNCLHPWVGELGRWLRERGFGQ